MLECEVRWAASWGSGGQWDLETEGMVGRGGGEVGGLEQQGGEWEGGQGASWVPPAGALTLPSPSPNRRVLGRPQSGLCSGRLPGFLQLYSWRGNVCNAQG